MFKRLIKTNLIFLRKTNTKSKYIDYVIYNNIQIYEITQNAYQNLYTIM